MVAAALCASCGATRYPAALPTSALPRLPRLTVARTIAGPGYNDVNRHYRYMILVGQRGTTSEANLRAEVTLLVTRGWHLQPTTTVNNANQTATVGLGYHGAVVVLNGPKDIYVALEYLKAIGDLNQAEPPGEAASPLFLRHEIHSGVPMLSAVLGHR